MCRKTTIKQTSKSLDNKFRPQGNNNLQLMTIAVYRTVAARIIRRSPSRTNFNNPTTGQQRPIDLKTRRVHDSLLAAI
jgi:hypothetical protein